MKLFFFKIYKVLVHCLLANRFAVDQSKAIQILIPLYVICVLFFCKIFRIFIADIGIVTFWNVRYSRWGVSLFFHWPQIPIVGGLLCGDF